MLFNYLKITIRTLSRSKAYTALNVLGLTLGITCFAVIFLYVENELSYDQFQNKESYRFLVSEQTGDGEIRTMGTVGVNTLNTIADQVAGIEDVLLLRDHGAGPLLVEYKDVRFKSRNLFFAEADFFDYFGFKLLQGNPKTVLSEPNNVVITESMAHRIFGDANPMGEFIQFSGGMNFTLKVSGVVEDIKNSHMKFDFLLSFDLKDDSGYIIIREGFANSVYGYFKLEEGTNPADVTNRIKAYYTDFYKDDPKVLNLLERESYHLQSVYDIYFGSNQVILDEGFRKGNKQNIKLLSTIGFFILLIACMNYINAATAKAVSRGKEIGVRKVFGAQRSQLFTQFIGEAFLVTLISILLSILATDISLPFFENLMQTKLRYELLSNPTYLWGLLAILFGVTLLSGLYPAMVMSGFKPSESIKHQHDKGALKGNGLRTLLVGVQLFFAVVLMSSILLILKQNRFMGQKDLGFTKDDILIIPNNSQKVNSQLSTYKNELLKSPFIYDATTGMDVLGFGSTNNFGPVTLEGQSIDESSLASYFTVGMDFLHIQGIKLKEGRSFNPALVSDSSAILVNEAFVKANGIEDLIGKKATLSGQAAKPKLIIGVVEDFNYQSLHSKVSPAIFTVSKGSNWFWTIKIDPKHKKEAVAHAKQSWEAFEPSYPMGYWFLEDNLKDFYGEEAKLQKAIEAFAVICLIISCLGIYGLTAFTIERRLKEIGIRKVLGAQVKQLVWMLNQRFVKLFLMASLLAIPIVYYLIDQWLQGFAYRVSIGISSFLLAGLLVLAVILITVSIQAIKVAFRNPIHSLRSE